MVTIDYYYSSSSSSSSSGGSNSSENQFFLKKKLFINKNSFVKINFIKLQMFHWKKTRFNFSLIILYNYNNDYIFSKKKKEHFKNHGL